MFILSVFIGLSACASTQITFYTPNIVRVTKAAVHPYSPAIDVVRLKPEANAAARSQLKVEVDTQGAVTFRLKDGTLLLKEDGPNVRNRQYFELDQAVPVYGFGSIQDGKFNRRLGTTVMCPKNLDDGIPFIQTVKGWGIFWNNTSITTYIGEKKGFGLSSECGDVIDYYFIYGGTMDGTIAEMRALTGDVPMLPRWSYGFWQSRERYMSQDELLEVLARYRELGIPLDGIVQDWQYWGIDNSLWNALEFLNERFPKPKEMVEKVHASHAHFILSVWPNFGPKTKPYAAFEKGNQLLPGQAWPKGARLYNAFDPKAREIYWDFLTKLWDIGLDGWWMDDTEPELGVLKEGEMSEREMDISLGVGTFRELRCAYPYATVSHVASNTRRVTPNKRVFILTRSAFAGQQVTGAHVWSGDTVSSWAALKKQLPAALGFSLTGNPNWSCDLGGFFAQRNDDFIERYVRFLQFGVTQPLMRSHGTDFPREFYFFGKPGEPIYDAMVQAVKLRYRLLPYLYSVAWECSHARGTFMRAMVMDFPEDERTWSDGSAYLCGHALLTSPVQEAKPKQVKTYLPKGADWWNYFTGERVKGGQEVCSPAKLDAFPLYVRAGSIIPYGPDVQWSDEKSLENLEVVVYPGANGAFTFYEDEGEGYGYEQGLYSEIVFRWDDAAKKLTIESRRGEFPGMLAKRTFRVKLQGSAAKEQSIIYDGQTTTIQF